MKGLLLAAGWLLCAGAAWAEVPAQDPIRFRASAMVEVDAEGVPQRVEPSEKLPAILREFVVQRVMQFRFEPVVIDGRPRTGTTHVYLEACAVPQTGGDLNVAMDYSWNGPGYAGGAVATPPPHYPPDAMRAGQQGSFRVVVKVETDGTASVESIETRTGRLKAFEPTLRQWVAGMRYVPERIDGEAVVTRIGIPVDFELDRRTSGKPPQHRLPHSQDASICVTATQGGQQADPVVLDSPFRPRASG